jgi:hypothetical protein
MCWTFQTAENQGGKPIKKTTQKMKRHTHSAIRMVSWHFNRGVRAHFGSCSEEGLTNLFVPLLASFGKQCLS